MKAAELTGAMLDLWVARAEGKCATVSPEIWGNACINDLGRLSIAKGSWDSARYFEPSSNWAHGGPIIEREGISLMLVGAPESESKWSANFETWYEDREDLWVGPTALIAAMRAFVGGKFGDTVPDVP